VLGAVVTGSTDHDHKRGGVRKGDRRAAKFVTILELVTFLCSGCHDQPMSSLALVVAQFYEDLAAAMAAEARERADERGAEVVEAVPVPGVYDAPLAADRLARREDVDAVAVLGAVVTGSTDHDQVVAHTAARQLSAVGLDRDTPVTFGVMGPAMTHGEAEARVGKAADAVDGAVDLLETLPESA
jgi:6,7-dimethyl-8-ribityllumazine synthase